MDRSITDQIGQLLQKATDATEALQARLDAGEDISDEEMTAVARAVAEAIEEANEKLKELVGPVDSALFREQLVEGMTPAEYEQWSEDNAALQEYRAWKKQARE